MRTLHISTYIVVFLLLVIPFAANSQQYKLEPLKLAFDTLRKENLQEKIYLHLDRDFYVTGEKIWFKVYLVDGTMHKPLNLDKVAYIEIVDRTNTAVLTGKVKLANGFGSGSFFIPASITSDHYTIRAYTQWMKNFSPEFYFHKQVSIVNTFTKPDARAAESSTARYKVTFFPEGGHLVKGLKSKIAFKVTDQNGKPVDGKIAILTSNNDSLAVATSQKFGLGSFDFTPETESTRAIFIDGKGLTSSHQMPSAEEKGYVINVTDSADFVQVKVSSTVLDEQNPFVYVFGHCRQAVFHSETKSFFRKRTSFLIPKKAFGEGINHLTVFDGSLNAVCERLYFRYPSLNVQAKVQTDAPLYEVRRKVKLNVFVEQNGAPIASNLSLSVFKVDSLSTPEKSGIVEYLYLTSDLQGKIDSPEFYFSNDPKAVAAMDNLMLTHGWRRFSWSKLFEKTEKKFVPEFRNHLIQAIVKDQDGKAVHGALCYLSSPDKVIRTYPSISDKGLVKFEATHLYGNRQLILQAQDSTLKIEIENPFSKLFSNVTPDLFSLANVKNPLTERSVGMQVQDIYDERNRTRFLSPGVDSIAFYGIADETYYLDDYTRFPVMEEVMREYVPGVLVRKRRDGFHFIILNKVHGGVMEQTPLILLDGMPIFDADDIMKFDPRKVKKLEVLARPYYLGSQTFYGIASYSTYKGDLAEFKISPKTVVLDYEGLQLQREFYAPSYETAKQRAERLPDFRNLLFWSPDMKMRATGRAEIEFFTSDTAGKYFVKVEGLTKDGTPVSATHTFEVKRFDN